MTFFVVDVEADGPVPGIYSMLSIGVVALTSESIRYCPGFYKELRPQTSNFVREAMDVNGLDRDKLMIEGLDPRVVMPAFAAWINSNSTGRPIFISDNNGFDFAFVNYYFHRFYGENPFGWSSRRMGDLWCGYQNDTYAPWKHMRKTKHTHNALDDAKGNAEALLEMKKQGLDLKVGQ